MTLLELCEPLFLKICELNRMSRLGKNQEYAEVRAEILDRLNEIHAAIQGDAKLAQVAGPLHEVRRPQAAGGAEDVRQIWEIELVLAFFVDSMIASSKLTFADQWDQHRVAVEQYNLMAGDDDFFEFLEKTKADSSDQASERLAVFYVCMGLGFVGGMAGQPDDLKRRMKEILPRIRQCIDVEKTGKVCPDAYVVDKTRMPLPVRDRALFVVILAVFLGLSTIAIYVGLYVSATKHLDAAVGNIIEQGNKKRP